VFGQGDSTAVGGHEEGTLCHREVAQCLQAVGGTRGGPAAPAQLPVLTVMRFLKSWWQTFSRWRACMLPSPPALV